MRLKIELYILSLWMLFALLFINKINIPFDFSDEASFVGLGTILETNLIPLFCTLGMLYGVLIYRRFTYKIMKSGKQGPWQITNIESISFENLSFLATYIIPLLCFDLDFHLNEGRNALMLVLVLAAIGWIYIKANLYYTNPSLAVLNFKIYKISYKFQGKEKKCIVLTRNSIDVGDKLYARIIGEKIYFVNKAVNNE